MRWSQTPFVLAALLALPLTACMTGTGIFAADGFHQGQFPMAVHYANPAAKDFLGPDWTVDNYYIHEDGSVGDRKKTKAYAGPQAIDFKGDGALTKRDTFYFDLKLDNRKTSGVIWVQTLPLDFRDGERNLKNLVEDYAENLSGTGFFAAVNDGRLKAKAYAAKIVAGADTTLGAFPAYDARLELANLDQARLDPSARTAVIRIVLVKTDYIQRFQDVDPSIHDLHTLVRVGYSASPSDFDAGVADFERFLKLLELGPASGPYESNARY